MATYAIDSVSDLEDLASKTGKFNGVSWKDNIFKLTTDLDLIDSDPNGDESGWVPIGTTWGDPFNGYFDGQGHIISNLTINRDDTDSQGLFGGVDPSFDGGSRTDNPVKNLGLVDVNIVCSNGAHLGGCVAATLHFSPDYPIKNCYVSGSISGDRQIGGFIGGANSTYVENCYADVHVTGSSEQMELAGFCGQFSGASIFTDCYSVGEVTYTGGGDGSEVGGFIGYKVEENCHEVDCFWDTETSKQATSQGDEVGKTTAEMKQEATFINWDFDDVWWMLLYNNYPKLREFGSQLNYSIKTTDEGSTTYPSSQRKLVRTSNGDLHCVYNRMILLKQQICYAKSIDGGETWTETVLTGGNYYQVEPSIAVDSNDYLHVVWRGFHSGSTANYQLRYIKYTDSWQSIVNLTSGEYTQNTPSIAVDSNDYLHVVWRGTHSASIYYQIRYIKYDGSWQSIVNLTSGNYSQEFPSIGVAPNNYLHVVWQGVYSGSPTKTQIRYIKYTDSWQNIVDLTDESYSQRLSGIAITSNSYLHVVWSGRHSGSTVNPQIRYRKYTDSWQNIVDLTSEDSDQRHPSIAVDSNDYLHVVWNAQSQIRYRKYTDSWQDIVDLVDGNYPNIIWSLHPTIDRYKTNRPENGYSFIWMYGEETVKIFLSADLEWESASGVLPAKASNESPADAAIDVVISTSLSWLKDSGDNVLVYLDKQAVNDPPTTKVVNDEDVIEYDPPSDLDLGTTYVWRVDTKNEEGTTTGDQWEFTTLGEGISSMLLFNRGGHRGICLGFGRGIG